MCRNALQEDAASSKLDINSFCDLSRAYSKMKLA